MRSQITAKLSFVVLAFVLTSWDASAIAAGGTSIIASKGQPTHVAPSWPKGVDALVNDASRTSGWNSWFTEWPNDVNQYAFEIQSTEDINRLIAKLAAVKSDLRQVRLSYLKEPNGLGWVTRVPEGNNVPVVFSIGDQAQIDQWFKHVRKPFGAMEFTAAPVAVPPTLTIFVRNESIQLDEIKIPDGVSVTKGYVPTLFHKSNTTAEKRREKEAAANDAPSPQPKLDDASMEAAKKIEAFLASREKNDSKP